MKKLICLIMTISILFLGCADNKSIDYKWIKTYGLIDEGSLKDPCINYELAWGNLIWSFFLFKTAVMPIYFLGFSLWEPVDRIDGCDDPNSIFSNPNSEF